ncbi:MAG: fluoride efflux transporter CrcB [Bacteroidota bacterium]|nr:fluoride efflux transporter CrcB [Bacteroidota bacterium]
MYKTLALVFVGGGLGSVFRTLVGKLFSFAGFPLGTFIVNIVGSLLIGFIYALFSRQVIGSDYRLFFAVGFCGGFTTFSTFSNESLHYLRSGQSGLFFGYALASVTICLLAVWLGDWIGQKV